MSPVQQAPPVLAGALLCFLGQAGAGHPTITGGAFTFSTLLHFLRKRPVPHFYRLYTKNFIFPIRPFSFDKETQKREKVKKLRIEKWAWHFGSDKIAF